MKSCETLSLKRKYSMTETTHVYPSQFAFKTLRATELHWSKVTQPERQGSHYRSCCLNAAELKSQCATRHICISTQKDWLCTSLRQNTLPFSITAWDQFRSFLQQNNPSHGTKKSWLVQKWLTTINLCIFRSQCSYFKLPEIHNLISLKHKDYINWKSLNSIFV